MVVVIGVYGKFKDEEDRMLTFSLWAFLKGFKAWDCISIVRNRKSKLQVGENGVYLTGCRIVVAGAGRGK